MSRLQTLVTYLLLNVLGLGALVGVVWMVGPFFVALGEAASAHPGRSLLVVLGAGLALAHYRYGRAAGAARGTP